MAVTISASDISGMDLSVDCSKVAAFQKQKAFFEGGHHLEKLEFALAVAETKGDQIKSACLRAQIADLGGNIEEPGT